MWPVDDAWLERILAEMQRQQISPSELARRAGVTSAAISILLNGKATQSRIVPQIHDALGLPPPVPDNAGDAVAELSRLWPDISEGDRQLLITMAAQMAARGRK